MVAVAITRTDLTAMELRGAAARSRDAQAARRMLELALVLEDVDRTTAAKTCGMHRQTLRDWVHRDTADGLAGLANRKAPARARRLDADQVADLAGWVDTGPDPAQDGLVRWRRKDGLVRWRRKDGLVRWRRQDLQRRIVERFGVELHERTVGKYLAMLGYRRLSVQIGRAHV